MFGKMQILGLGKMRVLFWGEFRNLLWGISKSFWGTFELPLSLANSKFFGQNSKCCSSWQNSKWWAQMSPNCDGKMSLKSLWIRGKNMDKTRPKWTLKESQNWSSVGGRLRLRPLTYKKKMVKNVEFFFFSTCWEFSSSSSTCCVQNKWLGGS